MVQKKEETRDFVQESKITKKIPFNTVYNVVARI